MKLKITKEKGQLIEIEITQAGERNPFVVLFNDAQLASILGTLEMVQKTQRCRFEVEIADA